MAKSKERIEARRLRRGGMSIKEIAKKLRVAKSSVSTWCIDIRLNLDQLEILSTKEELGRAKGRMAAAKKKIQERKQRLEHFAKIGSQKVGKTSLRDLFMVGIALYWAEGDKRDRRLMFCNSDPRMILIWIRWLKVCLDIPLSQLTFAVGINEAHKERVQEVEKYWANLIGVSLDQFTKTSLKKVKSQKVYENHSKHFGTLMIKVQKSTNLSYEVLGQIEGISKMGMLK